MSSAVSFSLHSLRSAGSLPPAPHPREGCHQPRLLPTWLGTGVVKLCELSGSSRTRFCSPGPTDTPLPQAPMPLLGDAACWVPASSPASPGKAWPLLVKNEGREAALLDPRGLVGFRLPLSQTCIRSQCPALSRES